MSISISTGKREVKSEPNVVPLCDVLLVLLIIFMIAAPLIQQGVDVKIPSALNTINMPENPEVVLSIRKDGTMYVNQDIVTLDKLQSTLEEEFLTVAERKLYLRADQDLEYGKIVQIIDVLREAGIEVVGIITEKKTTKAE
jgi:biopolymer transport protein TolR